MGDRKLRRHFSQKSLLLLAINLLLVNLLFAIMVTYQPPNLLCIIIASLLHYFVLASFSWMFIMALIQYLLFVKVFPRSISAFTRKAAAFAQGNHSNRPIRASCYQSRFSRSTHSCRRRSLPESIELRPSDARRVSTRSSRASLER